MIGCGSKKQRGALKPSLKKSIMALGRMSVPAGMRGGRMGVLAGTFRKGVTKTKKK
jgi:hypothetical protein